MTAGAGFSPMDEHRDNRPRTTGRHRRQRPHLRDLPGDVVALAVIVAALVLVGVWVLFVVMPGVAR